MRQGTDIHRPLMNEFPKMTFFYRNLEMRFSTREFLVTFLLTHLSCSHLLHVSPADSGCDVTISRPIWAARQEQCVLLWQMPVRTRMKQRNSDTRDINIECVTILFISVWWHRLTRCSSRAAKDTASLYLIGNWITQQLRQESDWLRDRWLGSDSR
jgi:hypothetical protein